MKVKLGDLLRETRTWRELIMFVHDIHTSAKECRDGGLAVTARQLESLIVRLAEEKVEVHRRSE